MLVSGVQQSEIQSSQVALVVKNPPANAGDIRDMSSISELGRSPGGGHGNPLQYSCLENPMDRGAWWATIHRVAKSWIGMRQLSTHIYLCICLSVYIYFFLESFPLQVSVILYIYIYFHYILFRNIEYISMCSTVGPWWLSILYSSVYILIPNS